MKQIIKFIQEKLKINSNSKIITTLKGIELLNVNINDLETLKDILSNYFKDLNYDFDISKTSNIRLKWKKPNSQDGVIVGDHFVINFKNKYGDVTKKLQFGIFHHENILMQLKICDAYKKWHECKIHGNLNINTFKIGDNFSKFILKIKELTDNKSVIGADLNVMDLFKLDK